MWCMNEIILSWPIAVLEVEIELHSTTVCGVTNWNELMCPDCHYD